MLARKTKCTKNSTIVEAKHGDHVGGQDSEISIRKVQNSIFMQKISIVS